METPKEITVWDLSDTEVIPDGYDMETVPKMSDSNFRKLLKEHNNLVKVVNMLSDKMGITIDDESE